MNSTWITPTRASKEVNNSENDKFLALTPHSAMSFQRNSLTLNTGNTSWQGTTYQPNTNLTSPVAFNKDILAGKDEIIEQKDIILQKQKMIIAQLRQTNSELEELLLKHQHHNSSYNTERMEMRLKEYQYQVSHLQKKILEERHSRQDEIDKLNRKLGEKEYEYGQLSIVMKENEISYNTQINKLKNQLDHHVQSFKNENLKIKEISKELQSLREEKNKLEQYLEEVPSNEEFQQVKFEVKELKKEKEELKREKELVEIRFTKLQEDLKAKCLENNKLCKSNTELKAQQDGVLDELELYKKQDELGPIPLKDHVKIKEELKQSKKKKDEMKLSLEKRNKKLTLLHYEILEKEKQHKVEVEEKDSIIKSLNDEILNKKGTISMLSAANQKLDTHCKDLQDTVEEIEAIFNDDYKNTFTSFITESDGCVKDMERFINLCKAKLNGTEPTINALLGIEDSPEKPTAKYDLNHPLLDGKLLSIKKEHLSSLREDIEEIRHLLSDQYAEKISQNMCITQ